MIILLFVIGLTSVTYFSFHDVQLVQSEREQILHRLFKSVVSLKGQPLYLFSYYYAHWGEMSEFLETQKERWAEDNLVGGMSNYHAEAIWVFDRDCRLVFYKSVEPELDVQKLIISETIPAIFGDEHLAHFFERTKHGMMEIRGAMIHKVHPDRQKEQAEGYFFVGHIWDESYVHDIAATIQEGRVYVREEPIGDAFVEPLSDAHGNLYFTYHFKGWDGTPLQNLRFEIIAPFVQKYVEGSIKSFLAGTLIWFMVFLFIAWSLIAWVNRPLKKITNCLKNEDVREIQELMKQPTEFGRICWLIGEFFQQKEQLKYSANHDALTGILNRGAILGYLDKEISRSQRQETPLSVIIVDLDHFKQVNDTYGHLSGDIVLKEVASLMRSVLRETDYIGRYGGEEFIVLAPGCNDREVNHLAERLKHVISEREIAVEGDEKLRVTASLGITSYNKNVDDKRETVIARADEALYRSKKNGRNRITVYTGKVEPSEA